MLVHEDETGTLTSLAHKRHIAQFRLHHPLEMATKEAVDKEDIECALMVGHDDKALTFSQMLASLNLNRQ